MVKSARRKSALGDPTSPDATRVVFFDALETALAADPEA
jgi:hypothetical protein